MTLKKSLSLALAWFLLVPSAALPGQTLANRRDYSKGADTWPNLWNAFKTPEIPEINLANSRRLEELIREAKLYLSLSDALALALENNLDLAVARYGPDLAASDVLRALSGQQLRGVQTQISVLSTGQSVAGGGGARGGDATGITGRAGAEGGGGGGTGDASTFFGTQAINLDPTLFGNLDWGHFSNPQTSDFVTGINSFVTESSNSLLGVRKAWLPGTSVALVWANRRADTNSRRNNFNPSLRSNVTLQIRQPLMQGFGSAVNGRNIRIAKNNREISDLVFEQQVIEVVVRVTSLYWDLVSFLAQVDSARENLQLAQALYEDNKRRVEVGTLAPIEIVRAEAEVALREEELIVAETRARMQETQLKNAISTNGIASPSLLEVRIVPTDKIEVPEVEPVQPIQDLISMAQRARPDLTQRRIAMENRDIALKGVRNAMLPSVDLTADLTNNGLAGQVNENFIAIPGQSTQIATFFLGGLGTSLGQILRRNFPDYSIAVNVSIPLRNRRAQADMAATLLERRQAQVQLQQQENQVALEVQRAIIGLEQARASYESALKTRVLQERTLEAEQKRFDLGASTIFLVVQAQRDLALSRTAEIAAQNAYIQAKVELDRVTGHTLTANHISLEEALTGNVSKPPDPLPPMEP